MTEHEVERLIVRLVGDGRSYLSMMKDAAAATVQTVRHMDESNEAVQNLTRVVEGYGQRIKSVFAMIAGTAGLASGVALIQKAIGLFSEMEDAETEFGTMLNNADKGKQLVAEIQELANKTPLQSGPLQQATKMLLQYGVAADKIIPTLRMIGDTSGGNAQKLLQMARGYGQMLATGRLQGDELNQLIEAGFNPLQTLAERAGGGDKAKEQAEMTRLMKLKEAGKLLPAQVTEAFVIATSEGGRFYGYMEKLSNNLKGLWSSLQDDVGLALTKLGDEVVKSFNLKQLVRDASSFFQEVRQWVPFLAERAREAGNALRDLGLEGFAQASKYVREFIRDNQELAFKIAAVTAAVVAGYAAYRVLAFTMTVVMGLMSLLKIKQALSLFLWVAWKMVLLAVTFVTTTYSVSLWACNVALAALTAATTIASGAEAGMTVATWILNIALAVLEAETVIPLIIAFGALVLTLGIIVGVLAAVTAGTYLSYKSADSLLDVLLSFDTSTGPIAHIGKLLGEWGGMLSDVAKVAQQDLGMAWKMLQKGAEVAVSQVMDLWPPLWNYIKEGWRIISDLLYVVFMPVIEGIRGAWDALVGFIEKRWEQSILGKIKKRAEEIIELFIAAQETMDPGSEFAEKSKSAWDKYQESVRSGVRTAQMEFEKLNRGFKVNESDRTKDLKAQFQALKDQAAFNNWRKNFLGGILGDGGDTPVSNALDKAGEAAGKAAKEMQKFDAAAFGSAEHLQRLEQYRDMLARRNDQAGAASGVNGGLGGGVAPTPSIPVTVVGGGGSVAANAGAGRDRHLEVLVEIRNELKAYNDSVGVMAPANVGGGNP